MATTKKKPSPGMLIAALLLVLALGVGGYMLYKKQQEKHTVSISIGDKELSATFE